MAPEGTVTGSGEARPSGWYPDPYDASHLQRYWDGNAWTEHVAPAATPPIAPDKAPRRPRRGLVVAGVAVVVLIVGFLVWNATGGSDSKGGGGEEAVLARAIAEDLIGEDAQPLGGGVPEQIPQDFPFPDDAEHVASFSAGLGKEDTVSSTFRTSNPDAEKFVLNGLPAAGFEPSSDFTLSLGSLSSDDTPQCAATKSTFGFFKNGDLIGIITVSEPSDDSTCKHTITVAVGPDVIRPGR